MIAETFISKLKISSGQAIDLIHQAVRYPDMQKEFEQVMDRSFGKLKQSRIAEFYDQKSAEFFEDEQGQRRYIVTAQRIGKATVHTPIQQKQEAEEIGTRDMKEIINQTKEFDDTQVE